MAAEALKVSTCSRALLAALALILPGCSLFVPNLRPVPGADRNLWCTLEYRPDPTHDGPDLLLAASANPYKWEEAYMNPLEPLVHTIIGPGQRLSAPVEVRGAVCQSPWEAGHRIPMLNNERHYLLCRRQALAEVVVVMETKWGSCMRTIPVGDDRPRCRQWGITPNEGLQFMSQKACSP